jgi:archaellum component FlaC
MTNLQLLLSTGIPCLLLAVSMMQSKVRLNSMEERFDGVDQRFDGVYQRIDGVDKRMDGIDARFNKVDDELRDFRAEHHRDLTGLHADLKEFME